MSFILDQKSVSPSINTNPLQDRETKQAEHKAVCWIGSWSKFKD